MRWLLDLRVSSVGRCKEAGDQGIAELQHEWEREFYGPASHHFVPAITHLARDGLPAGAGCLVHDPGRQRAGLTEIALPWLSTPDVSLRYEVSGDGPDTLLLLHEMGGTLESWESLLPLLLPRYRIVRYDQRGAGLSEKPRQPFAMADAGRDALALLDALDIRAPIVLIGTAVGGAVALHVAAAYPGRVRAVIATSPATGVPASARQALLDRAALLEFEGTRAVVDPGLDQGYPPPLRGDAERFAQTRAQRMAADPFGQAATMRMLAGLDMAADLASIACPALIIAGLYDLGRPPERVAPVAEAIPGAEYRVMESGHFMAIQTPEFVAAEIHRFLDGIPALRTG